MCAALCPLGSFGRFTFDDEALEIYRAGEETENIVVGGRNRWTYDSFVNWEFWWPNFPVLVYFKVGGGGEQRRARR